MKPYDTVVDAAGAGAGMFVGTAVVCEITSFILSGATEKGYEFGALTLGIMIIVFGVAIIQLATDSSTFMRQAGPWMLIWGVVAWLLRAGLVTWRESRDQQGYKSRSYGTL